MASTAGKGAELAEETRQRWLGHLYSTAPADRPLAEAAVRDMYKAAEMQPPARILWLDSPYEAAWTVLLLDAQREPLMRRIVESLEKSRSSRERLAAVRAAVAHAADTSWESVAQGAGRPLWGQGADPQRNFELPVRLTRISLWGDPGLAVGKFFEDPLFVAEAELYGLFGRALGGGGADMMFSRAITNVYNFLWMAIDEEKTQAALPPPVLESAWRVARSAGPWWAFSALALLAERPAELHSNAAGEPSRGDGPAILYRNGWKIYAWNGGSMPEKWILHPESIPPGQLRQADKSFRQYLVTRMGAAPYASQKPVKPSKVLQAKLPADPVLRLQQLRKHAGGKLPLYNRYMAGERSQAWQALQALGEAVRAEPHAADALAVAYETMRRVEANVRTVVERLSKLGYRFRTEAGAWQERENAIGMALELDPRRARGLRSPYLRQVMEMMSEMRGKLAAQAEAARKLPRGDTPRPHILPAANTANLLKRLEKKAGMLPLSLCTFYEVVGAVDLQGNHPSLSPKKSTVCPDPLVVFPLEDVLAGTEEMAEDDGDIRLQLAPDDIHKAGESGGEPYEITVPDARADSEFLNERHGLLFVDYLRLAFRFGGFPGYEGYDRDLPPEIAQLSNGLMEF